MRKKRGNTIHQWFSTLLTQKTGVRNPYILLSLYCCVSGLIVALLLVIVRGGGSFFATGSYFFLLFILWLVLFELTLSLVKKRATLYCDIALLVGVGALFVRSWETLLALLILGFGFFKARKIAHETQEQLVELKPLQAIKAGMSFFLTLTALSFAIFIASVVFLDATHEEPIPRSLFDVVFVPIEDVLQLVAPSYTTELNTEEVQQVLVSDLLSIDAIERLGLFDGSNADVSFADTVYSSLNHYISKSTYAIRDYLSLVTIVALFLFLRVFALIVLWVSYGIYTLVIKVLLLYNIISVQKHSVQQERVHFT